MTPVSGNRYVGDVEGGYELDNVKVQTESGTLKKYHITDTRMQLILDKPLKAKGGKAEISMDFKFKIPVKGMDRMGRLEVEDGVIYACPMVSSVAVSMMFWVGIQTI